MERFSLFTFANPWGLLALASLPAIVAIYLYRQRFRRRPVAGLFLWGEAPHLPPSGRTRSRIETPLTLLVELLAALLLAFLLSGARWQVRTTTPHCIVILDHSASMRARRPGGDSSADRALRVLEQKCRSLGSLDSVRLTVILSGQRPELAVGPAALARAGLEKLESWSPMLPHHALAPALTLAERLADAGGQLMLVTDHPGEAAAQAGPGIELRGVGCPLPNAAIAMAERRPDPGRGGSNVIVRVANFSREPVQRTLLLEGSNGKVLHTQQLSLEGGAARFLLWRVGKGHSFVAVRLKEEDALDWDNRVVLAEPRPSFINVRCEFEESDPVRQRIEKACAAIYQAVWLSPGDHGQAHLVIRPADGLEPGQDWVLGLGPAPVALRAGAQLGPLLGPYFPDSGHPLMTQLDFRGVIWSGAYPVAPDPKLRPLLTAGDVPLLFSWGKNTYVMNMDPGRSNCHKSPAWPMFFHNLIELRREQLPGLRRWNFRPGEVIRYRLDERSEEVTIHGPDGEARPLLRLRNRIEVSDTWHCGSYEIRSKESEELLDRFAVNFLDPNESDLSGTGDVAPLQQEGAAGTGLLTQTARWPWLDPVLWLLLLALVLVDLACLRPAQRRT